MSYKNINVTKHKGIATITINRPEALNALNMQTLQELKQASLGLESDQKIQVVVLTGAGKAFIAGADIKQMKDMNTLQAKAFSSLGHSLLHLWEESRLPIIAAVNGFALGGGCELMMACDLAICSSAAKLGQPEVNLGIHPGFGGTQRLPRLVGKMKAKELLLTGDMISAEEAHKIGLVNMVVEPDNLMETVQGIAEKIASKSSVQTCFIKELVNKGADTDLSKANMLEISYFASSFATHDQKEGMSAFLEKRKPQFQHK